MGARFLLTSRQHDVIVGGHLGAPAGLDDDGLVRLDEDGGPVDPVAGGKALAQMDRRLVPFAFAEKACHALRPRFAAFAKADLQALADARVASHGLDRQRLDDDGLFSGDEAEALAMRRLEARLELVDPAHFDEERRVRAGVAQVKPGMKRNGVARNPLRLDFRLRLVGKR